MMIIECWWLGMARLQSRYEWSVLGGDARSLAQSTVEYALVGALVVLAAAGAMTLLGGEITNVFTKITTALSGTGGH